MAHDAQLSVASVELAPALKEPGAHASHARSLLALAAVLVKVPGPHGALTGAHASPLSTAENVVPATHAPHWRSASVEPAADWPWPAGHVAHAVHDMRPALAVNVPCAHVAQARSLLTVATAVVYVPEAHAALTATHASPLVPTEYVAPATQAAHWRSEAAVPSTERP